MGRTRLWALILFSLLPVALRAQGVVTGQETTITYTGTNAPIVPPNTPANNFASPGGTNTFLLPVSAPAVSVRLYITNNTANACASTFTLQMFSVTNANTTSFNNALANWQTIPLQNSDGTLISIATPNIPASGAVYISSLVVAAPRVAIQLVNVNILNCPATNVEVTATVTPVALTSPLVSNNNGFNAGTASQVQGVTPSGANGVSTNPVIAGGLAPAINGAFLNQGLDNFSSTTQVVTNGFAGTVSRGTVPRPSSTLEWALFFGSGGVDSVASTIGGNSPWSCNLATYTPGGCAGGAGGEKFLQLPNVAPNTALLQTFANANGTQNLDGIFLLFKNTPVFKNQSDGSRNAAFAVPAATAGSVVLVGVACQTGPAPCVSGLASTLGMNYQLVARVLGNQSFAAPGVDVWMATNLSPGGADTITPTFIGGGGPAFFNYLELASLNPASVNQPNLPFQVDASGNQITRTAPASGISPSWWAVQPTSTTAGDFLVIDVTPVTSQTNVDIGVFWRIVTATGAIVTSPAGQFCNGNLTSAGPNFCQFPINATGWLVDFTIEPMGTHGGATAIYGQGDWYVNAWLFNAANTVTANLPCTNINTTGQIATTCAGSNLSDTTGGSSGVIRGTGIVGTCGGQFYTISGRQSSSVLATQCSPTIKEFTVGNPAAGSDWATTLPQGFRYQIISVTAKFTTSATAGTRCPTLLITDSGATNIVAPCVATQGVSLIDSYNWEPGIGAYSVAGGVTAAGTVVTGLSQQIPLPSTPTLTANNALAGQIQTTTSGIQAGDQWATIIIKALVWNEND